MSNIKEALLNYESEEGHNPIVGLLNTLTFIKSLPVYWTMSVLIALAAMVGVNIMIWGFLEGWLLCLLFSIGSIFGAGYLAFTGFFYFAITNFIDNLKDIVLGTIEPIDKVYWKWVEKGEMKMSKKDFFIKVVKEEIFPSLLDNFLLKRFKSRMSSVFDDVLENVEDRTTSSEDNLIKERFESAFIKAEKFATKPYFKALKIFGGFSVLIILLILI